MRGNADFETKYPAIWEFGFMKRRKHSDLFVGQVSTARHRRA
jgi:hypothetical protein